MFARIPKPLFSFCILAMMLIASPLLPAIADTVEPSPPADGGASTKPAYDRSGWPDKLTIAYPSIGTQKETLARYAKLDDHLASWLSIEVEPMVTDGYEPIYAGFQLKTVDVAYMGPMSYAELCEYVPSEPAVMELEPGGKAGYHALLIARSGSEMEKLEDAEKKILGMVDEHSTSGFLIPTLYFIKTLKTTPQLFAEKVLFAGTHDAVIAGVKKGTYDVAATNDIDLARACGEQGFKRDQFVVLWKSRLYPSSPFAIRKDLPESLKKAYQDGMLAANKKPEILSGLGIGGFATVADSAYDPVRELRAMVK